MWKNWRMRFQRNSQGTVIMQKRLLGIVSKAAPLRVMKNKYKIDHLGNL